MPAASSTRSAAAAATTSRALGQRSLTDSRPNKTSAAAAEQQGKTAAQRELADVRRIDELLEEAGREFLSFSLAIGGHRSLTDVVSRTRWGTMRDGRGWACATSPPHLVRVYLVGFVQSAERKRGCFLPGLWFVWRGWRGWEAATRRGDSNIAVSLTPSMLGAPSSRACDAHRTDVALRSGNLTTPKNRSGIPMLADSPYTSTHYTPSPWSFSFDPHPRSKQQQATSTTDSPSSSASSSTVASIVNESSKAERKHKGETDLPPGRHMFESYVEVRSLWRVVSG